MTCLSFFQKKSGGTSAQSEYVNIEFFLYKAKEGEGQRRRKEEADFSPDCPPTPYHQQPLHIINLLLGPRHTLHHNARKHLLVRNSVQSGSN